jgi:hypothetical protein
MPVDVRAHISRWTPRDTRPEKHVDFIRRTARKARPQTITDARGTLAVLLDYVDFLTANGVAIRPSSDVVRIFDDNKLRAWERDVRIRVDSSVLTNGSANTLVSRMTVTLERLGKSVVHGRFLMGIGGTKRAGASTQPTRDADVARWLQVADAQPDDRGARFKVLVLAARGAGLGIADFRHLRGCDVVRRTDGVVTIRIVGDHARTAVVLDRFGSALLSASAHFGEHLVVGEWADSRNVTGDLVASIEGGAELDRKQLVRALRRAYVVEILQTDTNPIVIQQQLGAMSLSEIEGAIPFVDPTHLNRQALRTGAVAPMKEPA